MNADLKEVPALLDVGPLDRRTYLGGSDIAAIMGVDPRRTPYDVWAAKVGDPAHVKLLNPQALKRMQRGKKLEPYVLEMLTDEHAIHVTARNRRYRDSVYRFLAAEIDFEWLHEGSDIIYNGEIKTVSPFMAKEWGDAETDQVPTWYWMQSQYGLMISGRSMCQYAVLFGADDLTLFHVERDDTEIARMRDEAVRFWHEHVLAKVPPPARTLEDLKALWPRDEPGKVLMADPNLAELADAYTIAHELEEKAKDSAAEARFQLLNAMGDAGTLLYQGKKLYTYHAQKSTRLVTERVRSQYPEVYNDCLSTTTMRVLRRCA